MRTRNEIELALSEYDEMNKPSLTLEVLLDIRELLQKMRLP